MVQLRKERNFFHLSGYGRCYYWSSNWSRLALGEEEGTQHSGLTLDPGCLRLCFPSGTEGQVGVQR